MRKKARNAGLSYVTKKGKVVKERTVGEPCSCKRQCLALVPQEERHSLNEEFWGLCDYDRQNDMLAKMVDVEPVKRHTVGEMENHKRKRTYVFTIKGQRVCKVFFLSTLAISEMRVRTVLEKLDAGTCLPQNDQRGRTLGTNKLNDTVVRKAIEHIDSFPRVPAHWCRANTKKEYLEATLTKENMFRLYLERCKEEGDIPVSKTIYMEILIKKNIGFHSPKKDSCWCVFFHELSEEEQELKKSKYEDHIAMKNLAKDEKDRD